MIYTCSPCSDELSLLIHFESLNLKPVWTTQYQKQIKEQQKLKLSKFFVDKIILKRVWCACGCTDLWWREINTGLLPPVFSTLQFQTEPVAYHFGQLSTLRHTHVSMASFYMDAGDLNLGSHVSREIACPLCCFPRSRIAFSESNLSEVKVKDQGQGSLF